MLPLFRTYNLIFGIKSIHFKNFLTFFFKKYVYEYIILKNINFCDYKLIMKCVIL